RSEEAEGLATNEGEILREAPVELHRRPVARPHRMRVHSDGRQATSETHTDARPVRADGIMGDLPRAPAADHGEDEAPAGPDESRALAGDRRQVRQTIERTQVGINAVESRAALEPLELVCADRSGAYPLVQACDPRTLPGPRHHAGRPVEGDDPVA